MALNGTQKNIIEGLLKGYIDDILESSQSASIKALQTIMLDNITPQDKELFERQNIWIEVDFIHQILAHPCPQNRAVSYPYFGPPPDFNTIVYKNDDGKPAFEQRGLLGLTARSSPTDAPVTKKDVVDYIHKLLYAAIEQRKLSKIEESVKEAITLQPDFFKKNKTDESISQIKSLLTDNELEVVPIMALVRLPLEKRLSLCELIKSNRHTPNEEDFLSYLSSDNLLIAGLAAFVLRWISIHKLLELNIEKIMLLATNELSWLFIDIGVDFEKLMQLETTDIEDILSYVRADVTRVMSIYNQGHQLAQEINGLIEEKITLNLTNS